MSIVQSIVQSTKHRRLSIVQLFSSRTVLLPPIDVGHVLVQIPHMSQGMVGRWTPSYPATVGTFTVRIIRAIGLMFHPDLLDLVPFTTEGTDVTPSDLGGCLNTMLGHLVLIHYLVARILLTTVRAFNLYYLTHKPLCAQSMSSWWQATSYTYHMGISHPGGHPCAPLNDGGS